VELDKTNLCVQKKYMLSLDNMKVLPLEFGHHVTQFNFESTNG